MEKCKDIFCSIFGIWIKVKDHRFQHFSQLIVAKGVHYDMMDLVMLHPNAGEARETFPDMIFQEIWEVGEMPSMKEVMLAGGDTVDTIFISQPDFLDLTGDWCRGFFNQEYDSIYPAVGWFNWPPRYAMSIQLLTFICRVSTSHKR